ncbi:MAG: transferase, partial [candidate division WOR-3 bacterium]
KTAIGSLFNSGCRVGVFANWFEPGLARKEIAPFSWGKHGHWTSDAAVANARAVMARRRVMMTPVYERAIRELYERVSGSRRQA